MDIQAYIQSGIIESYVLGLASVEETVQLERLRLQHPEVEKAIEDFSLSLEQHALNNAVIPPNDLKDKILSAVKEEPVDSDINVSKKDLQKSISPIPLVKMGKWRIGAAASVILLVLSALLNLYLYSRYQEKKEAYNTLLSQTQTLQANNGIYQTQLKEFKSATEMMGDPLMLMVKMGGVKKGIKASATVFWNTKNKDVFVMVNKLPEKALGKQYQLWAMVNGKPVDAGMIDPSCSTVCKMKNIPQAQAFAITLEKQGGSSSPDLSQLFVMGNI